MTRRGAGPRESRLRARGFGIRAEWIALAWLTLRGYRVLARNYLVKGGEIDLIAARGRTIAFVEVKARPSIDAARTAITLEKRRRISRAATHWLARNPAAVGQTLRGDAIFIAPRKFPRHVENVYELDLF